MRPNLALIGFMGVGKSTIGRLCARRLGYGFRDTDFAISLRMGRTIPDIFASLGEAEFRAIEREIVAELAAMPRTVISTGGGVVLDPLNVDVLRAHGRVVWLRATPEVILRRVGDARARPLLAGEGDRSQRVLEMLEERTPIYNAAADYSVDTNDRPPYQIVQEIIRHFS